MDPVVLAVGLDGDLLKALTESADDIDPGTVVYPFADAAHAREWLAGAPSAPAAIVASFREEDAWGLNTLFSRAREAGFARRVALVLVCDLPVAALPVLITDLRGLRAVTPGSAAALLSHLDSALHACSPAVAS